MKYIDRHVEEETLKLKRMLLSYYDGDIMKVEDAIQNVYLNALERELNFKSQEDFNKWFCKTAKLNAVKARARPSAMRKEGMEGNAEYFERSEFDEEDKSIQLAEIGSDPLDNLLYGERLEWFERHLTKLTYRDEAIVRLVVEGKKPREIAAKFGLTPKNISKIVGRWRNTVKGERENV